MTRETKVRTMESLDEGAPCGTDSLPRRAGNGDSVRAAAGLGDSPPPTNDVWDSYDGAPSGGKGGGEVVVVVVEESWSALLRDGVARIRAGLDLLDGLMVDREVGVPLAGAVRDLGPLARRLGQ